MNSLPLSTMMLSGGCAILVDGGDQRLDYLGARPWIGARRQMHSRVN
jgi:hypothetical protein